MYVHKFASKIRVYNKAVGLRIMGTGIPVPIPILTVRSYFNASING